MSGRSVGSGLLAAVALEPLSGGAPIGYGWALLKMAGALILVCLLAYLLLRLLARVQGRRRAGPGTLRVVDRCPISSRQSLVIAQAAGRFFLLGVSDQQISRLAELDGEQLAAADASGAPPLSFSRLLAGDGAGSRPPAETTR